MASIRNARVLFNEDPGRGYPTPGRTTVYDDSQTIDINTVPLNGGFLIKTLSLSIDPYLRGMMSTTDVAEGLISYTIGQPTYGRGVGLVIRSEFEGIKAGDHVFGHIEHQEYTIRNQLGDIHVFEKKHDLPWSVYLGAAGIPGQTAYMGWKEFANAKAGETVFVTTGAGPVGSFVIQLAKKAGCKVIASAGSNTKVEFMKSIGADVAFNYKTTNTAEVLKKEGPIDIYWDHVGGEILDTVLTAARVHARFIECGMISGYNGEGKPIQNLFEIIKKDITVRGFGVHRLIEKYAEEFYATVPQQIADGEIKYTEEITPGLENVGKVILDVQKGLNKAKSVIHVADE